MDGDRSTQETVRSYPGTRENEEKISLYLGKLIKEARYEEFIASAEALGPLDAAYSERRDTLVGHARLALAHDKEAEVATGRQREQSDRWLFTEGLFARIGSAIRQRCPFAFIRLGDGEARFAITMTASLRPGLSIDEAWAISRPVWTLRFNERIEDVDRLALSSLMEDYTQAVRAADVLGVSNVDRLSKPNLFGYFAAQEVWLRDQLRDRPNIVFTDAVEHFRLNDLSPFLAGLLRELDFIGLISPHPDLASRLASHLGIRASQTYVVPGESLLPRAGSDFQLQRHFPDVYRRILATLSVPYSGAVFLVAAGLLGKVYCAEIKQRGGIALDIGAVADAWMGYDTRPEYRRQALVALDGGTPV